MRRSALLVFAALALAGCPEKTQDALPPAGLAGAPQQGANPHAAANPHAGVPGMGGAAAVPGMPGMAGGAASQPAAPHPPMGTHAPGAASQPAAATVIPGGGADAASGAAELSGVVSEAHHVKEYTYVRVKADNGSESWAAVLKDESIGVGTKVAVGKDVWMSDFQSPSLNKTFDRILFGRVISKQ